jgi:hypothetical protein
MTRQHATNQAHVRRCTKAAERTRCNKNRCILTQRHACIHDNTPHKHGMFRGQCASAVTARHKSLSSPTPTLQLQLSQNYSWSFTSDGLVARDGSCSSRCSLVAHCDCGGAWQSWWHYHGHTTLEFTTGVKSHLPLGIVGCLYTSSHSGPCIGTACGDVRA